MFGLDGGRYLPGDTLGNLSAPAKKKWGNTGEGKCTEVKKMREGTKEYKKDQKGRKNIQMLEAYRVNKNSGKKQQITNSTRTNKQAKIKNTNFMSNTKFKLNESRHPTLTKIGHPMFLPPSEIGVKLKILDE